MRLAGSFRFCPRSREYKTRSWPGTLRHDELPRLPMRPPRLRRLCKPGFHRLSRDKRGTPPAESLKLPRSKHLRHATARNAEHLGGLTRKHRVDGLQRGFNAHNTDCAAMFRNIAKRRGRQRRAIHQAVFYFTFKPICGHTNCLRHVSSLGTTFKPKGKGKHPSLVFKKLELIHRKHVQHLRDTLFETSLLLDFIEEDVRNLTMPGDLRPPFAISPMLVICSTARRKARPSQ
nr:MAG TPA: hypothetical protein [Caudoviricetes sp.]